MHAHPGLPISVVQISTTPAAAALQLNNIPALVLDPNTGLPTERAGVPQA